MSNSDSQNADSQAPDPHQPHPQHSGQQNPGTHTPGAQTPGTANPHEGWAAPGGVNLPSGTSAPAPGSAAPAAVPPQVGNPYQANPYQAPPPQAPPRQQPYPQQPYGAPPQQAQPHQGHQNSGQQYPGHQYPGQQYQGQPYQGQQYPGQPYQAAPQGYGQHPYGQAGSVHPNQGQPGTATPPDLGMAFPAMQKSKVEPLAVASVATFWTGILGLILGVVGLRRTKTRGTRSPGLATTGIVLSTLVTVASIVLVTVFALNGTFARWTESAEAGNISERTISSTNLATGNCIASLPPGSAVGDVRVVPCEVDHFAQVVSTQELPGAEYPGANEVAALAETACHTSVEAVLSTQEDAAIEPWYIVPSEAGWNEGKNTAICLVRSTSGQMVEDFIN